MARQPHDDAPRLALWSRSTRDMASTLVEEKGLKYTLELGSESLAGTSGECSDDGHPMLRYSVEIWVHLRLVLHSERRPGLEEATFVPSERAHRRVDIPHGGRREGQSSSEDLVWY